MKLKIIEGINGIFEVNAMRRLEVPISSLQFKINTQVICRHGCNEFKKNPLCPPYAPNISWFEDLFASSTHATIFFEPIEFNGQYDLKNKKRSFNKSVLDEEYALKKQGKCFAVAFFSGACEMCDDCIEIECTRPIVGRFPVCAIGLDLQHLFQNVLNIPPEQYLNHWRSLLPKEYLILENTYFAMGLIIY